MKTFEAVTSDRSCLTGLTSFTPVAIGLFIWILLTCSGEILAEDKDFLSITGPCDLEFPRDHGSHPGYRTEWWYYTGNVRSKSGQDFGFQLTFFRVQISLPGVQNDWPSPASTWRTQQIYMAHAAVSDIEKKRYVRSEMTLRETLGMAGVVQTQTGFKVFAKNWSASMDEKMHRLEVDADDFSYRLTLTPLKPPILHGDRGYSRKGATAERASCYYSISRLKTAGTLSIANSPVSSVEGLAWMDHEFSTAPLEPGIIGWDWFSIALDDHTELMVYFLRLENGSAHPASSGTFIDAMGGARHLPRNSFQLEVLATWKSPESGAEYPAKWRLKVLPISLNLTVASNLADQEMVTPESTNITYWEGSVSAEGKRGGDPVKGSGYVEMTGYVKQKILPDNAVRTAPKKE